MKLRDLPEYKGKYPDERVQIFVDGSNLYHALKSECGRIDLDYLKFAEKLTNGRKLIRLNLYVATFDSHRSPKEAREQQRFIDDVQKLPYITVKHKMLNYKDGIPYEKGIDILIAVDMVTQALWNYYDTGILVSGDGDFAPMLSRIKNAGKQVENASFDARRSKSLIESSDLFIELTPEDLQDCFKNSHTSNKAVPILEIPSRHSSRIPMAAARKANVLPG
jgi:uncharacterized LabA/DUF88 family protein